VKKLRGPGQNTLSSTPVINASRLVFEFAQMDEYQDLMTKESPLVGERISRFGQLHKAPTMC